MYLYQPIHRLQTGQYFQFGQGLTINQVVLRERNLLVYTNVITKKNTSDKVF